MLFKRKCYSTQKFPRRRKLSLKQFYKLFTDFFFRPSPLYQKLRGSKTVNGGTYLAQPLIYKPEEGWYGED